MYFTLAVSAATAQACAGAELFRRMTTRRVSLLRPGPAGAYLASLTGPGSVLSQPGAGPAAGREADSTHCSTAGTRP